MHSLVGILLTPRGRMNRTEFATVFLGGLAIFIALVIASSRITDSLHLSKVWSDDFATAYVGGFVLWKYIAIVALVKRLHDMSSSGFWWLLLFVPFAALILYLIALFGGGTKEENKYGSPSRFFERRLLPAKISRKPA